MRQSDPGLDPSSKLSSAGSGTFNAWLQQRLEGRRLSQRQLAEKTGVDHSTISRLIRGQRMPTLRTAALLAKALGGAEAAAMADEMTMPASRSRLADVEYALRSDESLTAADVREIMELYLKARSGRTRRAPSAPKPSSRTTPVPIVVQVPREGAAGSGRHPGRIRHRSG